MFLHVSVCTQGRPPPPPPGAGTTPGTKYTPQDQVHPPDQVPPPPLEQVMLGDTGNMRAVRILLERIFVFNENSITSVIADLTLGLNGLLARFDFMVYSHWAEPGPRLQ